jgi:curli biogenesis system outer membrane secretion channel CsgG
MTKTFVIPALLFVVASVAAQTTPAQTATAPSKNPVSSALRDIMPNRQKNTIAAVEAMPADKFSYKPSADQITFGHLVAHMVEANYLLCSKPPPCPLRRSKK